MDWGNIHFDDYARALPFESLVGQTIVELIALTTDNKGNLVECVVGAETEVLILKTASGDYYRLYHEVDECDHDAWLEDVTGDMDDLLNSPIITAYESSSSNDAAPIIPPPNDRMHDDSWTWTFYRIQTAKGCITMRWYGTSNGYYSESVDLTKGTLKEAQSNER